MSDLIDRNELLDFLYELEKGSKTDDAEMAVKELMGYVASMPSAKPQIKPITYHDCSNAMMMMWMNKIVTDGEYNKIMDRLNKFEIERRKTEKK